MRIHVMHPRELGAVEIERWRALRLQAAHLANPYFSPEFAQAIGAARDDARIAVVEDAGVTIGFLAVQRPSSLAAMALGSPLADYQGFVGLDGMPVDGPALCAALKVGRIDFSALCLEQKSFSGAVQGACESFVARLGAGGAGAYLATLKAARADTVKKMNRKRAAMERENGPLAFTAHDTSRRHFEQLMTWNRAKCRQSNQPPVWETRWVLEALEVIRSQTDPAFRAILFTDVVGGRLAAAQLLLQSDRVLHTWVIGHDPALEAYSPGMGLTRRVIEWAADEGFEEVDLGLGDYRFKRQLTNATRAIGYGFIARRSWSASVRATAYQVRNAIEKAPLGTGKTLPGRVMRRIDTLRGLGLMQTFGRKTGFTLG